MFTVRYALACLSIVVASGCSTKPLMDVVIVSSWESQIAEVRDGRSDRIEMIDEVIGDEQFAELAAVADRLRVLSVANCRLSAESYAQLGDMRRLEFLTLKQAAIDDSGLTAIARASSLKRLNLPHAAGTDAGLAELAKLPNLEQLRIGGKRTTGAGLVAFEDHAHLRFLHFIDAPIGDAALDAAAKIVPLESLYIDENKASDEAWQRLFEARPSLHVHDGLEHHDRDPRRHDHSH